MSEPTLEQIANNEFSVASTLAAVLAREIIALREQVSTHDLYKMDEVLVRHEQRLDALESAPARGDVDVPWLQGALAEARSERDETYLAKVETEEHAVGLEHQLARAKITLSNIAHGVDEPRTTAQMCLNALSPDAMLGFGGAT